MRTDINEYTIYGLTEDDGITPKTPIAQLIMDLEHDDNFTIEEKFKAAISLANEININAKDRDEERKELLDIAEKYNTLCSMILHPADDSIRKAKEFIFHGIK